MTEKKVDVSRRLSCGSFAANGHFGTANDYVLGMFITCVDGPRHPTRIACGDHAYSYFIEAWRRQTEQLTRALASELTTVGRRSATKTFDAVNKLYTLLTAERIPYLYGAEVVHDREVNSDTILFYEGDRLVGECRGWTS